MGFTGCRENRALQLQPRRGDLKVAQDAVLGDDLNRGLVPQGRLKRLKIQPSLPGLSSLSETIQDRVLGYLQVAPLGLDLQVAVITHSHRSQRGMLLPFIPGFPRPLTA
jgi:hypothetical protein